MNIIGNPVKPTIRESAIGAINKRIICPPTGILRRGATGGFMKYVNPVLMPSGSDGKKKMKKDFEAWVRQQYGNRYDLTRGIEGFYCREVVKRMFETWCHCRGLNVA
ncbi:hypothetical protein I5384_03115 [Citrobacter koseri]|uniref:hypothetical protein n=1 Tax=Citrobacter koseri TaxID=545 RepID=UPI0019029DBD|nr:hypothetical protein [Citrobacter koseri]MBJ8762872.1 hypothetical protein [Citrobacter koseri]MBJ9102016.1 hypothetical protein [Citrobacter koseri]HEM6680860.1 hypothetical protein [Citrobacter koseri]HEM6809077.1 hypothetical protein [Citrobacter koseri]